MNFGHGQFPGGRSRGDRGRFEAAAYVGRQAEIGRLGVRQIGPQNLGIRNLCRGFGLEGLGVQVDAARQRQVHGWTRDAAVFEDQGRGRLPAAFGLELEATAQQAPRKIVDVCRRVDAADKREVRILCAAQPQFGLRLGQVLQGKREAPGPVRQRAPSREARLERGQLIEPEGPNDEAAGRLFHLGVDVESAICKDIAERCPRAARFAVGSLQVQGGVHRGAVLAGRLAFHPKGRRLAQHRRAEGDLADGDALQPNGQGQGWPDRLGGRGLVGRGGRRGLGQTIQYDAVGLEEPKPQGGVEKGSGIDLVADIINGEPRACAIADAHIAGRNREGELAGQTSDSDLDLARRRGQPFDLSGGPIAAAIALEVAIAETDGEAEEQQETRQSQARPLRQLFHACHVRTPDRSLCRTGRYHRCRVCGWERRYRGGPDRTR